MRCQTTIQQFAWMVQCHEVAGNTTKTAANMDCNAIQGREGLVTLVANQDT